MQLSAMAMIQTDQGSCPWQTKSWWAQNTCRWCRGMVTSWYIHKHRASQRGLPRLLWTQHMGNIMIGIPNLGRNHSVGWLITYAKSDHYFFLSHHWILFFVMLLSHTMYFVFTVSDNTWRAHLFQTTSVNQNWAWWGECMRCSEHDSYKYLCHLLECTKMPKHLPRWQCAQAAEILWKPQKKKVSGTWGFKTLRLLHAGSTKQTKSKASPQVAKCRGIWDFLQTWNRGSYYPYPSSSQECWTQSGLWDFLI